ncbi:MAG: type 1 glutamine amidotransferase [Alphaproteobacteria bacterium]
MNILVLQHMVLEHPGVFRRFLAEDGHRWTPVQLDQGETPPPLDGYDALWVMGGPMDVWQTDLYPWLDGEKALIREAVGVLGMPFFGLCLGHQLLAEALGGACGKAETPEIGVMDVELTEAGASGVLFDGLEERFACLQWHGAEVTRLPAGAECLATSPACAVQAMSVGGRAFSMQFHTEVEEDTIANWNSDPIYAEALMAAMGPDGAERLAAACAERMPTFHAAAERVYINWMQAAAH